MNMDDFHGQFNRFSPNRGTIRHKGDKLKPNQKCPCGSGKKYKRCCQNRLERIARAKGSHTITKEELDKISK